MPTCPNCGSYVPLGDHSCSCGTTIRYDDEYDGCSTETRWESPYSYEFLNDFYHNDFHILVLTRWKRK